MQETQNVTNVTYEEVTVEELLAEIDEEARRRLGMSGEEFIAEYRDGSLEVSLASDEIAMLVRCVDYARVQA